MCELHKVGTLKVKALGYVETDVQSFSQALNQSVRVKVDAAIAVNRKRDRKQD